ncbi:hypothetical protein FB45DRAFT_1094223 [Roridomyces roridus]|uniref:Uncharacterized protein n=1 Tax=Roridomyces roridus TaxID=1738132 RepID=A0AAD7FF30_9AGAR|nr:hypothetical protein FB45DRAFT_1094223 [Roridomyces roridus]
MSAGMPACPVFPPELERSIFEICASEHPTFAHNLLLVAWRVKEWIEAILYRTIVVGHPSPHERIYPLVTYETLSSLIRTRSPEFLRDSVKNLLFSFSIEFSGDDTKLLSTCSRLENLWFVSRDTLDLSAHDPSTLKRLYIYDFPTGTPPSVFTALTHLELMGWKDAANPSLLCTSIANLPSLTHLAFSQNVSAPTFLPILQSCASLLVLISFDSDLEDVEISSLQRDVRFVLYRDVEWLRDWEVGVQSGVDYWYRAERFVRKRQRGEVNLRQTNNTV